MTKIIYVRLTARSFDHRKLGTDHQNLHAGLIRWPITYTDDKICILYPHLSHRLQVGILAKRHRVRKKKRKKKRDS